MYKGEYSGDLKQRVILHVAEGSTQRSAAKVFKIGFSTVNRWWNAYLKDGSVSVYKKRGNKGKVDPVALASFVKQHPEKTLREIGEVFGVSDVAIHKRLKQRQAS